MAAVHPKGEASGTRIRDQSPDSEGADARRVRHEVAARLFGAAGAAGGPARLGRFELRRRLGVGASGEVHAAWDPQLEREVALKLLARGSEAVKDDGILREARAAAGVRHPNVASVFEVGEHEGQSFLAMELVEGPSSWAWAAQASARERLRAVVEMARGIAAAHEAGLAHGDVKPANVLIDTSGHVKLADFGLSRPQPKGDAGLGPTRQVKGSIGGTPAYADPALLDGSAGAIEAVHDQHAFGITAIELLSGRHPFGAQAVARGGTANLRRSRGVPANFHRELVRCTGPIDARRDSMQAVVHALERAAGQTQRRAMWAMGGVTATAAAVALGFAMTRELPCVPSAEGRVLGSEALGRVSAAFEGEPGQAVPLWWGVAEATTRDELQRHAQQIRNSRDQICQAEHVEHAISPSAAQRANDCLDRREAELRGFLRAMHTPSDALRQAAARAASELPDASACERAQPVQAARSGQEPSSEHDREIEGELLGAQFEVIYGQYKLQAPRLDELDARMDAVVDLRVKALLYLVRAQFAQREAKAEPARAAASKALALAAEAGDLRHEAEAAIALAWAEGYLERRQPSALAWLDVARAATERAGGDAQLEARVADIAGTIAYVAGDAAEAAKLHRAALEGLGESGPALRRARVLSNLGADLQSLGASAEAVEALEQARGIIKTQVGADHPDLGPVLTNLSYALLDAGRAPEALAMARRALEIKRALHGEGHVRLASSYSAIGTCAWGFDLDIAAEAYAAGLEVRTKAHGPDDPRLYNAHANSAAVELMREKPEAAATHAAAMLRISQAAYGPEDERTVAARAYLGGARAQTLDPADPEFSAALSGLVRVVDDPKSGLGPADRAVLVYFLGRAQQRGGVSASQLRARGERALSLNAGADPQLDKAVGAWLGTL